MYINKTQGYKDINAVLWNFVGNDVVVVVHSLGYRLDRGPENRNERRTGV